MITVSQAIRLSVLPLSFFSIITFASASPAKKPAAKPKTAIKPKKPAAKPGDAVRGTQQVNGGDGHFGQTYTLKSGFNFTLVSGEYTIARVNANGTAFVNSDQKILVLHYKIKNSTKADGTFDTEAHTITVVDANGESHTGGQSAARSSTGKPMETSLKPGQGYEDIYTPITLPGKSPIVKLILNQGRLGTPDEVTRFSVTTAASTIPEPGENEIAPLPDYARDPADASGGSTMPILPAKPNLAYPLNAFDGKLTGVTYTNETTNGATPDDGKQFLIATFAFKNCVNDPQSLYNGLFGLKVRDADGDDTPAVAGPLKAKRDEDGSRTVAPGEEVTERYVFSIPKDGKGKTLTLSESDSHSFAIDISAF